MLEGKGCWTCLSVPGGREGLRGSRVLLLCTRAVSECETDRLCCAHRALAWSVIKLRNDTVKQKVKQFHAREKPLL